MYTEAFAAARSVDASSGGKCTASNCGARHPMEMDLRASGGVTSWWSKQPSLFPFGYGLSCERSSQPCSAEASAVPPALLSPLSLWLCADTNFSYQWSNAPPRAEHSPTLETFS